MVGIRVKLDVIWDVSVNVVYCVLKGILLLYYLKLHEQLIMKIRMINHVN